MSRPDRPEFSRPVSLARLGAEPYRREIAADEAERAALAVRFDLLSLDRLTAVVELSRRGEDLIQVSAAFEADFVQSCVVTLDPVAGSVSDKFALLYGPPEREADVDAMVGVEVAFEPLHGETIDIGEAVAQEFSLSLPQFPRLPEAEIEASDDDLAGPFAALARLATPHDD